MGSLIDYSWCRRTISTNKGNEVNTTKQETSFEDAWADIYWVFAHDDMAFDYRSQYYKERFLKTRKGLVDFQKNEIAWF